MPKTRMRTLLLLHVLLLGLSLANVASKRAAGYAFLSPGFIACYGAMMCVLVLYALGWQQVIKRLPLSTAYANRGITVVWGVIWGLVFFSERITVGKVVGSLLIVAGIGLFAWADARPVDERGTTGAGAARKGDAQ